MKVKTHFLINSVKGTVSRNVYLPIFFLAERLIGKLKHFLHDFDLEEILVLKTRIFYSTGQFFWHLGNRLHSLVLAQKNYTLLYILTPGNLTPRCYTFWLSKIWLRGVIHIDSANLTPRCQLHCRVFALGKFTRLIEKYLSIWIRWPRWVIVLWKSGNKSRDTVPFNIYNFTQWNSGLFTAGDTRWFFVFLQ